MSKINFKEAQELNQNFIKTRSKALDKIVEIETGKPKSIVDSWRENRQRILSGT